MILALKLLVAIVAFIYFDKATKFQKSSNCFDDTVESGRIFQIVCGLPIEYMSFEK